MVIRWSIRIENLCIHKCSFRPFSSPKPFIAISKWAPSCVLIDKFLKSSVLIGCNSGSTPMFGQISVRILTVKSLISLCWIDGKPFFRQDKQRLILKLNPHVQCVGVHKRDQSHLGAKPLRKAALCKIRPEFDKGSADRQLDAPFLVASLWTSGAWLTNAHASQRKLMYSAPFCLAYISFL